ncbi:TAFII55 protein conserved region-domain-containing protein [Pterulicium gracile]|uniref:TAFII55 protein conserved region-domain-containing protein n=1 Tax=Pterulicium gracile TaxID=1884261 RepID=A0A5C3QZA0_9AGAR|nr:TAFII55 protein conserved region-domain-containing protein [Pterula gracilis]
MDDDLIVIDDPEEIDIQSTNVPDPEPGTSEAFSGQRLPKTVAEHALSATSRPRRHSQHAGPKISLSTPTHYHNDKLHGHAKAKSSSAGGAPKLKLKLSEKAAALAPGSSFLGQYDRELDSDDEDLAFEEQFILRMAPGEDCDKLRKIVAAREVSTDVWFKFKDSRRAVFHVGNNAYSAKLVDLPCVVESQKTLDNKQMFKVADICQMLVVENRVDNNEPVVSQKNFNIDEFIWPHGVTPPLHHVRKRRFRKRMNKRTIESVEEQVERLMMDDDIAAETSYDFLDNVNPDWSDSELIEREEAMDMDAPTPAPGSDIGDAPTPGALDQDESDGDEEEDGDPEGDIDEELAAELDLALVDDDGRDDDDDDESDDDDDDDEDEDEEEGQTRSLLAEEIRDLEAAVAKKTAEIASSSNPLIKKRFEDALKKLSSELEMKIAQRDDMKEQRRMRREGVDDDEKDPTSREASIGDDLFGDNDD